MPTQKRRKFQIKQRQQRRKKNLALTVKAKRTKNTLYKINTILRRIIERKIPPTEIEKELILKGLRTAEPEVNAIMIKSIGAEKRLGQTRASCIRHSTSTPFFPLRLYADLIATRYNDQTILNELRRIAPQKKVTKNE